MAVALVPLETQILSPRHNEDWLKGRNVVLAALGILVRTKALAHRYRDIPLNFVILGPQIAVLIATIAFVISTAHSQSDCSDFACTSKIGPYALSALIIFADSVSIFACAFVPGRSSFPEDDR